MAELEQAPAARPGLGRDGLNAIGAASAAATVATITNVITNVITIVITIVITSWQRGLDDLERAGRAGPIFGLGRCQEARDRASKSAQPDEQCGVCAGHEPEEPRAGLQALLPAKGQE
jgi:hypothetical protein